MSDDSEPFACLDGYQSLSNTEFHLPNDGIKQFKVSYNKAFHTSEDDVVNGVDHVTQLNNIPGYSFLVTEAPPLQKMVVTNNLKHEDFSGGLAEGKRLRKTTSCPNKPFVTVSDISLRTRPSHLPPPSRPPPVLSLKDGNCNSRSSKLKASRSFAFGETTSDDDSPLYYDVEVDASLSAAATKGVMEKALAELESAKHVKDTSKQAKNCGETSERDFGGVKGVPDNAIKLGEKYGLLQESSYENLGNVEWKQNEEFYEVVETDDSRKLFDMGDDQRFVVQNLRDNEHGREKRGSRAISHQEEVNRKMTSDSQIHEKIIVEAFEGADFENMAKVWKKENEEERYQDDFVMEEHRIRLRENEKEVHDKRLKEAMETAKIEKRLKETFEREERKKKDREAWEREEKEKREIEASGKELEEKRLREEKEENEKRLRLASEEEEKKQMEAWEREEIEKSENEARERELEEKRLREAIEKRESENRLRLALEEKEKKQREAREIEEKEKREKEVRERGEKEKREKEARERGEKEKREKEAREREVEERRLWEKEKREKEAREREVEERRLWEKEKREKEAREREVEERRLRKALEEKVKIQKEREEKEKQEKEAQERELEEKRLREATEQEEKENKLKMALKKEENEKKRNLACERDEAEKRLKDDLRSQIIEEPNFSLRRGENKEKFNEGSELEEDTQVQEVNEREDNEKRLKEAFEHEEIDKLWEEDNGLHESGLFCGPAIKGDKNSGEPKKGKGSQAGDFSSSGVARDGLQHKKSEIGMGGAKESLHMHDTVFEFDKKQSKKAANFAKLNVVDCDSGTRDTNPRKVQVGKDKKEEKFMPSKEVKEKVQSRNAERKGKNLDGVLTREEREREERLHREKELENERLRKIEEEREREREREKDRMAVDMASLERAAVERAKADAGQRVPAEARERLEKSNAEARLRAERAAVERATAEARERAFQKAKAGNATVETRERVERMRQSSSRSESCQAVGSTNGSMKAYSSVHVGVEVESAQRCKARLERHQRTAQRAAKALEEKNMRDLLAQRELAERNRLAEGLDAEVKRWSSGKEGNLRALLSTLQYILGPDSGWQPIPLTEVITSAAVKRAYRKATLCVHPDKLQQRGASVHQKYICEKVFDLLKAAWNNFNSEER